MIITTAGRAEKELGAKAQEAAQQLQALYVPRKKRSISQLQQMEQDDCIVMGRDRLELYPIGVKEPFFFHPNSAMFRIKRLLNEEHDPFIEAAELKNGMTLLDCTLGLGSDSIVGSFATGSEGQVIGAEVNKYIAFIVKEGLSNWDSGISQMNKAMQRIKVINKHAMTVLAGMDDRSIDCVYFDPMFEETIVESDGIKSLTRLAHYEKLTEPLIAEALRVARHRVILKDHYQSSLFSAYHFNVLKRKTAKFHYGFLQK
ncbi:class I SAM-dependent methyltransferase [Mesobacillus harenae]|uniref:class I SAM-dependent methyltransferase n=1 Tax=Mesobacillus harenae TaxID=2213203 RepID=UPI0015808EE9|nr:class I SAM-dependent methyltransferase [Mesobacillus harenae]